MCTPIFRPEPKFQSISMVLVSPVPPEQSWADYLRHDDDLYASLNFFFAEIVRYGCRTSDGSEPGLYSLSDHACLIGDDSNCMEHEICQPVSSPLRQNYGVCRCTFGYERNATGSCQSSM